MNLLNLSLAIGVLVGSVAVATPPSEVLDLAAWKLTLPYDTRRAGDPDEVLHPELATFADADCFYTADSGDAVVFRAACDGRGTTNSKYPRAELREMAEGGKDEAGWATDSGKHVLDVELAITNTPAKKRHVVCVQIHDPEDDVLMVRLEGKKLFIERDAGDIRLSSDYQLGERFQLRLEVADGRIQAWHDGDLVMDWPVSRRDCYFKVGCYTQSNNRLEGGDGSFGQVEVYKLSLSHDQP